MNIQEYIAEREAAGDETVRVALHLPQSLAGLAWEFVGDISEAICDHVGGSSAPRQVAVSSTLGCSDISFSIPRGDRPSAEVHIYVSTPEGFPL